MKVNYSPQKSDARIELLPLIDVIFCILTFFMLAAVTLTRQSGINVDLPQASTGVTQMSEMLLVSVDPVGLIYVEKEAVSQAELRERLIQFRTEQPTGIMVLYASRLASYNDVVRVLDTLREVGGDRVALATLPESETADDGSLFSPDFDPLDPDATLTPLPGGDLEFESPVAPDVTPDLEGSVETPEVEEFRPAPEFTDDELPDPPAVDTAEPDADPE